MDSVFTDYNECRSHSSINYFLPRNSGERSRGETTFREEVQKKDVEVICYD